MFFRQDNGRVADHFSNASVPGLPARHRAEIYYVSLLHNRKTHGVSAVCLQLDSGAVITPVAVFDFYTAASDDRKVRACLCVYQGEDQRNNFFQLFASFSQAFRLRWLGLLLVRRKNIFNNGPSSAANSEQFGAPRNAAPWSRSRSPWLLLEEI